MNTSQSLECKCGKTKIVVSGAPILSAECHCESCRKAAEILRSLPASKNVVSPNGGTPYVLYRKDRVTCTEGQDYLKEFTLSEKAPTRRVVASCCNTPVFLEFRKGHWLSLFASLWPSGHAPDIEMRTMTSDLTDKSKLSDDIPNAKTQSFSFMIKLLGAWISMGFKTSHAPAVAGGKLNLPAKAGQK